ncbi:MAG: PKD domain-containing protein [Bacteroidia bacterium]
MKLRMILLFMLVAGWLQAQHHYHTLFLGNSYTYTSDLPGTLQALTLAGGDTLTKDQNTPGGYTLQGHSTNATSLSLIRSQPWDFVVLQEQSQLPSFPQSQVQQDVYPYATQLDDSIKANDSCSVTVFFMTWGRKYGDAGNCQFWPPVCTYSGMQYELRRSYLNMANQNSALVAPCGIAWWESMLRDSTVELYINDWSHPSDKGTYLNACVFYATMYRRSPVGLGYYAALDTTTATYLQQVAHDVVFDSLTQWRVGLDDAHAAFNETMDTQGNVTFTNLSSNANSYQWSFGDGGTDSVASPTHTYANFGNYPVTLIVSNGCTSDTLTDTLLVIVVGTPSSAPLTMQIFPNPGNGRLRLESSLSSTETAKVRVHDAQGREVWMAVGEAVAGKLQMEIDLSGLPTGAYSITLECGAQQRAFRHYIKQ